jgi:hypothetical protein
MIHHSLLLKCVGKLVGFLEQTMSFAIYGLTVDALNVDERFFLAFSLRMLQSCSRDYLYA